MARFVFLSSTPANTRQGSGTYTGIAALQQALQACGHSAALIAPATASPAAWRRLWFNWRLRGRRFPDAQIIGFDLDGMFVAGARVAALKGVLAEEMRWERGVPRARLWFLSRCERWRVRHAERVLVTSRYAAEAVTRGYGVAAAAIRIVPELLEVATWQAQLALAVRRPRPQPAVLAVAHLYPRKDVATLLRALTLLPQAVCVRIAGDGPERRHLERMAVRLRLDGRVRFLGHVPPAALLDEYRNADVFCHPSRQEGFGIVLLEAMASGLPIVAARAAAIPEVVPESRCGLLFAPGDARGLAAALARVLDAEGLRSALAAQAREYVWRFDAAVVAKQFLQAVSA